jgi:Na(+)-translocating NADH:ubiquinone oxidoreductase F subunit
MPIRRNYSFATNPAVDHQLRFNIRIATPPHGQTCLAGAGSAYVHRLKPGDTITAIGPFGSFHVKPGSAEMVYVGGGAGMAPLRSHLSHLFETLKTERRVGFWYGARSRKEVFYQDYFESLERRFPNFSFHVALSEPRPDDAWPGHVGLIHEVLRERYLMNHANLGAVEYYLCGPPLMIKATTQMLHGIGVDQSRISFDEF